MPNGTFNITYGVEGKHSSIVQRMIGDAIKEQCGEVRIVAVNNVATISVVDESSQQPKQGLVTWLFNKLSSKENAPMAAEASPRPTLEMLQEICAGFEKKNMTAEDVYKWSMDQRKRSEQQQLHQYASEKAGRQTGIIN